MKQGVSRIIFYSPGSAVLAAQVKTVVHLNQQRTGLLKLRNGGELK